MRGALRTAYLRALDMADLVAGRRGALHPPRSLNFVGDPRDFRRVGDHFGRCLVEEGLQPTDSVIDVGCGVGRIAVPLTQLLTTGSYLGVDIVPSAIDWCSSHITPRHPRFRFEHLDAANATYNPGGRIPATAVRLPADDGAFDFAVLTSVFTHMLPAEVEHYLVEIARVLKPGGRSFITYFLWNDPAQAQLGRGLSRWEFAYPWGEVARVRDPERPENAIALQQAYVEALYDRAGLGVDKVRYGSWRESRSSVTSQDAVVATKR
jgi:SAM-dependent methyltransferase